MLIKFNDTKETHEFTTPLDVVNFMHQNSHDRDLDLRNYMINYSKRSVLYENKDLRAHTVELFFEDLVAHKHITILK